MSMPGLLPRVLNRFGERRSARRSSGPTSIEQRKADHISINLERDVQSSAATGLEQYRLVHACLPEIDHSDVDPGREFLGKWLAAPILVSSMTGGVLRGGEINRRLAVAAQELGCAMGVGSQRAALENPELVKSFRVRDIAPDILLLANLGAVQLNNGYGIDECRRAVDMIEADALILHLNPVQEALQPDGNRNFGGLLARIASVCRSLEVPVVVKEIGFGISAADARRLADAGVSAIDVAGAGGTSWSAVERHRAANAHDRRLGQTFTEWGIPTATTLRMAREGAPQTPIIASGGLKSGLDAAKVLALGADLAGYAGPLLKAADAGEQATVDALTIIVDELRLAMFASGVRTVHDLSRVGLMIRDSTEQFQLVTEPRIQSVPTDVATTFGSTSGPWDATTQPALHEGYHRHAI